MKKSLLAVLIISFSYLSFIKYQEHSYNKQVQSIQNRLFPVIKKLNNDDKNKNSIYHRLRNEVRETVKTWVASTDIKPKHIGVFYMSEIEFKNPK